MSLGIGIGLISYVTPVYIVEVTPKSVRGAFAALNAAKMGREEESEVALQCLGGKNADVALEAAQIKEYMQNLQLISEDGFLDLFQQRYARAVIVGVGLMALQQFGGISGYVFYLSSILKSAGFTSNIGTVLVGIEQIMMNIVGILLIDRCGRRPVLMVAAVVMCMASLLTGLSFLLQDYHLLKEVTPILALLGVLVFTASISIGMGGIPWIIVSEIIPINIKGPTGALVNLVSWSSGWLVSYSFNFLFQWSSTGVFFIYAIVSGLGVIFIAKLVPETKGLTLEEIQTSITQ